MTQAQVERFRKACESFKETLVDLVNDCRKAEDSHNFYPVRLAEGFYFRGDSIAMRDVPFMEIPVKALWDPDTRNELIETYRKRGEGFREQQRIQAEKARRINNMKAELSSVRRRWYLIKGMITIKDIREIVLVDIFDKVLSETTETLAALGFQVLPARKGFGFVDKHAVLSDLYTARYAIETDYLAMIASEAPVTYGYLRGIELASKQILKTREDSKHD